MKMRAALGEGHPGWILPCDNERPGYLHSVLFPCLSIFMFSY